MTLKQLETRVEALEKAVVELREQINGATEVEKDEKPWWVTSAGPFGDDPVFDEIVRLGREYRQSLHPDYKKKKKAKKHNQKNKQQ